MAIRNESIGNNIIVNIGGGHLYLVRGLELWSSAWFWMCYLDLWSVYIELWRENVIFLEKNVDV